MATNGIIAFSRAVMLGFVLLATFFLAVAAFAVIGATLGGNLFQTFEAFGVRGYEATSIVGALIGAVLGIAADYLIVRRLARKPLF